MEDEKTKPDKTSNADPKWFHIVLQSIADAVITTDKKGAVQYVNPVAEHLTGWAKNDAVGKPLEKIFHILNEETRKKVENPVKKVLREGIVVGLANHTLLIAKDGREIPIADSGAPIKDDKGETVGVVLVFRDQTEERKAQRAVQGAREFAESIITTIREPLIVLDGKLRVISANRSFYQTFQVKEEETAGNYIYDLGDRQWDIPKLRELLEEILPANTAFDNFEIEHDFPDIGRRIMLLNARRIYRETNKTQMILLAIEDITERKQAEEKLKEYSEHLEELVEGRTRELKEAQNQLLRKERLAVLGSLAGGVGHELRNPLGVISNAVYYLKTVLSDADKTTREYLGIISSEVHNAEKIISDLLNFSRIKPGEREEVEVSALVKQVLDRKPAPKKIKVSVEIAPSLPYLHVDRQQIVHVLDNIVLNAYQAMPEGGKLIVRAKAVKDKMHLTLTDTGCGIPRKNRGKIFDPLFTTKARGIGLGLSVSRRLVEANGGKIRVKSEEGKGTAFTLILPVKESRE